MWFVCRQGSCLQSRCPSYNLNLRLGLGVTGLVAICPPRMLVLSELAEKPSVSDQPERLGCNPGRPVVGGLQPHKQNSCNVHWRIPRCIQATLWGLALGRQHTCCSVWLCNPWLRHMGHGTARLRPECIPSGVLSTHFRVNLVHRARARSMVPVPVCVPRTMSRCGVCFVSVSS